MKNKPETTPWVPVLIALAVAACGGGGSSPTAPAMPVVVTATSTVAFVYQMPTATDPAVEQQFGACVQAVGRTHIHPSWHNFDRTLMTAVGADRWEITFSDVPTSTEQRIRISDPNVCRIDPNGASTTNAVANGVLLTRVVDTPGNGTEPGLAFTVADGGAVTP